MSLGAANRILIVDDQANWREAQKILLESEGFDVFEATNFREAEDALATSSFNVVVLDVRLVDEDTFNVEGLALQNMIRANSPETRIVILTGYPKSVKDTSDADAFIFKVPQGSTFDTTAYKKLIRELTQRPGDSF